MRHVCLHIVPTNARGIIWAYAMFVALGAHVLLSHIL